ncbi:hypothetical protein EGW08_004662 [Elysia chlorotica]|uniref:Mab-21-like HhH/H2TH-like domain-containing protein n=1 Tax=Elysia chlorotica TaxID=188477 RepID=A0A3S1ABI2_ELYCH|nr:hypothetical protein EGW08_004662 [Elysia chlorotica]
MAMTPRKPPEKRVKKGSGCELGPLAGLPALPPEPNHLYVPRLQRQATIAPSPGPLASALASLAGAGSDTDHMSSPGLTARRELRAVVESIRLGLSRNQLGLKFRKFVLAQSHAHWEAGPERRVVCFLPVEVKDAELSPGEPGTARVRLPDVCGEEHPLKRALVREGWNPMNYVSSGRVYSFLMRLVARGLLSKQFARERIRFSATHRRMEIVLEDAAGWVAELVPCLTVRGTAIMFCCKPFFEADSEVATGGKEAPRSPLSHSTPTGLTMGGSRISLTTDISFISDSSSHRLLPGIGKSTSLSSVQSLDSPSNSDLSSKPLPDVLWYACAPQSENRLAKNIYRADSGVRMCAMRIVHKLCAADWRLRDVSIYQVQTAMLHEADYQLDHRPRWQRQALEGCTRAILASLGRSADARRLPHFLVQGVNLWGHLPIKQLARMSGAIRRLTTSDVALVSLACRAGQFAPPADVQLYSDYLSPRMRHPDKRKSMDTPSRAAEQCQERSRHTATPTRGSPWTHRVVPRSSVRRDLVTQPLCQGWRPVTLRNCQSISETRPLACGTYVSFDSKADRMFFYN